MFVEELETLSDRDAEQIPRPDFRHCMARKRASKTVFHIIARVEPEQTTLRCCEMHATHWSLCN